MNSCGFFYLDHRYNKPIYNHPNNLLTYPKYPTYYTYPLYFNTQLIYYPYNDINSVINPWINSGVNSRIDPEVISYYSPKINPWISSDDNPMLQPKKSLRNNPKLNSKKPVYKHQIKKPQPIIKKTDLNEIIKKINYSWILSDKFAAERELNEVKNNYDLNGDENIYKKSNIYKIIHNINIIKTNDFYRLDHRLHLIEELIRLGAKVDYKTTYFEDSVLYDFMKIIEDNKLNIEFYYNYRNDFYQSYIDKKLSYNNLYVDQYLRTLSLLLSKNIQTKFKFNSEHTLTPLDYARKLHIDYFVAKRLK